MHRPRMLSAALVATVLLLSAGCGGDDGGEPKEDDENFAALDGQEVADAAEEDMRALKSMRYAGGLTSGGQDIGVDVQASEAGDCTGTLDVAGGSVEVLATGGESWFRADAAFWEANAPDEAAQIIAAVGDSWVVDSGEEFSQFCDLEEFLDSLFNENDEESTYTNKGTDEIDGEPVVEVESQSDDGLSTGFILIDAPHYLVRIVKTDTENSGEVTFSAFDEEVSVEAPAEDEIVDLNEVG